MSTVTVSSCLVHLQVTVDILAECSNIEEEFGIIKKCYYKVCLKAHPDKGGSAEAFRNANEAFETIRDIYEKRSVHSFAASGAKETTQRAAPAAASFSYAWFESAAEETVPYYRVELAKSGRSECQQKSLVGRKCGPKDVPQFISKGEVRVGSLNEESGSYGRWHHLSCWRVAHKIWLGLPDPDKCKDKLKFSDALSSMNEMLFCGFSDLTEESKALIVQHVMNKDNWAKPRAKQDKQEASTPTPASSSSSSSGSSGSFASGASNSSSSSSIKMGSSVVASASGNGHSGSSSVTSYSSSTSLAAPRSKGAFKLPVPGVDGALADFLSGKTVVLTGIFPQVGGGAGLSLGKDRVKKCIESFGGKVTSAISGRTDLLITGSEPGMSKVSKARQTPRVQIMTIDTLKDSIEGRLSLEDAPSVIIDSFSQGYTYKNGVSNGRALTASDEELDIAMGHVAPTLGLKAPKAPKAKKEKKEKKEKAAPISKKKKRDQDEEDDRDDVDDDDGNDFDGDQDDGDQDVGDMDTQITCDGCAKDCTEGSYFSPATQQDFCDDCKIGKKGLRRQVGGVTVAETKPKTKKSKK